ncbi:MAG: ASKHA domain-containing protein [Nitrososphaerota archaeon]
MKIVLEPIGKIVDARKYEDLLKVCHRAGINILSECGGIGVCGKCRIIIKNQEFVSKHTEAEKHHFSKEEINEGYRLACQTKVLSIDGILKIIIPKESISKKRRIQSIGFERKIQIDPLIRKIHLILDKPSLYDLRSDSQRIIDSIIEKYKIHNLGIDFDILGNIPNLLRECDWDVTAVLWNNKIIGIEKGDTSKSMYGLAIDIGTSKIVCQLIDLINGETIDIAFDENPQIPYGEDIMSRITYIITNENGLKELSSLVKKSINKLIEKICLEKNIDHENIYEAVIVGNTAMHHIFLEIQPKYLALAPYVPAISESINISSKKIGLNINKNANIHILPVIGGFVGADAVADVLATGIHELDEICLLIDIGTNSEVFLGNKNGILAASCASGPAFEGMQIKYGMKAISGAIEEVLIKANGDVIYKTIDNLKPIGICGSGAIDIVAELFINGFIDNRGRFINIENPRIIKTEKGYAYIIAWKNETAINEDIFFSQEDINAIQLAKSAIHTACVLLMKKMNIKEEDIDKLFIAGAFGNYLNPISSINIGLIPDIPIERISFVGNTAISGAKMCLLSKKMREEVSLITKKIKFIELAIDPEFPKELANSMYIPYKDLSKYPSVKEKIKNKK